MKILSWNIRGNKADDAYKEIEADIYCFQESHINLEGAKINTINSKYSKDEEREQILKKDDSIEKAWDELVPWIEFPENYFAEYHEDENNFVLINVHLAGFYSKRYSLMSALLKRISMDDLKEKNVVLLGDFNAQTVYGTSSKAQKQGSKYLEKIKEAGFSEVLKKDEKPDSPIKTYFDEKVDKKTGFRYDHVFIKKFTNDFNVELEDYIERDRIKSWISDKNPDHKGILINIIENSGL